MSGVNIHDQVTEAWVPVRCCGLCPWPACQRVSLSVTTSEGVPPSTISRRATRSGLTSKRGANMGRKWPSRGDPDRVKTQVRMGAPPGTRTPNPQIKSLLLRSLILSELVPSDAGTCRDLPFCAGTYI